MNIDKIYLDYAASTPMDERVVKAMVPYFSDKFYNPSSPYLPAVQTRHEYEEAKTKIAKAIGAKKDQLIITAGATESINLAFSQAMSVVISAVEHPSVERTAKSKMFYRIAPVDKFGRIDLDLINKLIDDDTDFVSVCLASSDLGTIQPISDIAKVVASKRLERAKNSNKTPLVFHCDASQGLGFLDVNVGRLGVDLLTISAGKIYGPKQVAALWIRPGVKLLPTIYGGGQENGLRSGTENVAGVIGFGKACELISKNSGKDLAKLRDYFENSLKESLTDILFLGHPKKRLPNFSVISFSDIDAERLIYRLEKRGVYASTGAACSANRGTGSMALKSLGLPEQIQKSSLRFSLGRHTTKQQIEKAVKIITMEVQEERERASK